MGSRPFRFLQRFQIFCLLTFAEFEFGTFDLTPFFGHFNKKKKPDLSEDGNTQNNIEDLVISERGWDLGKRGDGEQGEMFQTWKVPSISVKNNAILCS